MSRPLEISRANLTTLAYMQIHYDVFEELTAQIVRRARGQAG